MRFVLQSDGISAPIKRDSRELASPRKQRRRGHVIIQKDGCLLQAREQASGESLSCQHLDLDFPAFRIVRSQVLLFNLSSLWYFVMATQVGWYTEHYGLELIISLQIRCKLSLVIRATFSQIIWIAILQFIPTRVVFLSVTQYKTRMYYTQKCMIWSQGSEHLREVTMKDKRELLYESIYS